MIKEYKKKIRFFLYFFMFIFLGKVSGFLKDILLTYNFGVSATTDAYFLAMSISALVYIGIYSAIPVIVVPIASKESTQLNNESLVRAFLYFLLFTILVVYLIYYCSTFLGDFIYLNRQLDKGLVSHYLHIMTLGYIFSTGVAFLNAIQTVRGLTFYTYLVPLCNNLTFCLGILLFRGNDRLINILILANFSWFFLFLINIFKVRHFFQFQITLRLLKSLDFKLIFNMVSAILLFCLDHLNTFIGVYFASTLELGSVSIYSYSIKLNFLVITLVSLYITTVLFPKFTKLYIHKEHEEIKKYCLKYMMAVLYTTVPIIIFMIVYGDDLVSMIFQRGKFTEENVSAMIKVFNIIILILPLTLLKEFFSKICFTAQNIFLPLCISLFAVGINILLAKYLAPKYMLTGIAGAAFISTLAQYLLIKFISCSILNIKLSQPFITILFNFMKGACIPLCMLFLSKYYYHLNIFSAGVIFFISFMLIITIFDKKVKQQFFLLDYFRS